jgi:hypothetical protein
MLGTPVANKGRRLLQCVPADPQLPFLAPEILAHLARQRGAQDTIDGIQWGVLHACTVNWVSKIAMTVAQLVEQGFLEEKRSSDGKIFYHISPRYLSNLQQPPPKNSTPDATQ